MLANPGATLATSNVFAAIERFERAEARTTMPTDPDGLVRWLARFDDPRTPYPPREIPEREAWPGDYDHLSRYAEWSRTGGGEEGS